MSVKFVLISTQRSGSTFIRTSLDSHPKIQCIGETFLPRYGVPLSFRHFVAGKHLRSLRNWLDRRRLVFEYLDQLYALPGVEATGFKFMYSQARRIPWRYPMVLDYVADKGIRVIHVIRRNTLKLYLSRESLKLRRMAHSTKPIDVQRIAVDTHRLEAELEAIEEEMARWRERLKPLRPMDLCYEDFVANREMETRRLLKYLDVSEHHDLTSQLVQLSPTLIKDLVVNYDELERVLRETRFAGFLDS